MRRATRSQRLFRLVILLTIAMALAPTKWLQPWTNEVAGLVNMPLVPFEDAGTLAAHWLRRSPDPLDDQPEQVQQLVEERDRYQQMWHAAEQQIGVLEDEVAELQDAQRFHQGVTMTPLMARITGRTPDREIGLLRLNVGSRQGVQSDTIAVYHGVHLIGRLHADVDRHSSWLLPIADRTSGLIRGVVLPADDSDESIRQAPEIHLSPVGDGTFTGDIDAMQDIEPGDIVRLSDPYWPLSAQAMIVGYVEDVQAKDADPLRQAVVVRPRYEASRLRSVTLKLEKAQVAEGATP